MEILRIQGLFSDRRKKKSDRFKIYSSMQIAEEPLAVDMGTLKNFNFLELL